MPLIPCPLTLPGSDHSVDPVASAIPFDTQSFVGTTQLLLTPSVQLLDTVAIVPVDGFTVGHPFEESLCFVVR